MALRKVASTPRHPIFVQEGNIGVLVIALIHYIICDTAHGGSLDFCKRHRLVIFGIVNETLDLLRNLLAFFQLHKMPGILVSFELAAIN